MNVRYYKVVHVIKYYLFMLKIYITIISSFAIFDLYGFSDEISVLSSTKDNVNLLDQILSKLPPKTKSEVWLPIFYEARKQKKKGNLDLDQIINEVFLNPSIKEKDYA